MAGGVARTRRVRLPNRSILVEPRPTVGPRRVERLEEQAGLRLSARLGWLSDRPRDRGPDSSAPWRGRWRRARSAVGRREQSAMAPELPSTADATLWPRHETETTLRDFEPIRPRNTLCKRGLPLPREVRGKGVRKRVRFRTSHLLKRRARFHRFTSMAERVGVLKTNPPKGHKDKD
jgi:hypothetical protein